MKHLLLLVSSRTATKFTKAKACFLTMHPVPLNIRLWQRLGSGATVHETRYSFSNSCNSPINNGQLVKLLANVSKTSNHVGLSLMGCGRAATFPTWENCRANHWQYKNRVQKLFEQHPALESSNSSTHSNYHHNHDDDEDPLRHLPLSSHYYLPHICLWIGYRASHY